MFSCLVPRYFTCILSCLVECYLSANTFSHNFLLSSLVHFLLILPPCSLLHFIILSPNSLLLFLHSLLPCCFLSSLVLGPFSYVVSCLVPANFCIRYCLVPANLSYIISCLIPCYFYWQLSCLVPCYLSFCFFPAHFLQVSWYFCAYILESCLATFLHTFLPSELLHLPHSVTLFLVTFVPSQLAISLLFYLHAFLPFFLVTCVAYFLE